MDNYNKFLESKSISSKCVGIELKESYFRQTVLNLKNAELKNDQLKII